MKKLLDLMISISIRLDLALSKKDTMTFSTDFSMSDIDVLPMKYPVDAIEEANIRNIVKKMKEEGYFVHEKLSGGYLSMTTYRTTIKVFKQPKP